MFESIIKDKNKKRFFIFISIGAIILTLNTILSIKIFEDSEIISKEKTLKALKGNNNLLNIELAELERANLEMFKYSVPEEKLKNDITAVCDSFKQVGIVRECQIVNIISPFEYKNVSAFTIASPYEVDRLIINRLFMQIYNIKNTIKNEGGVNFEIFNKIK